jgi:hypothetical protein
LIATKKIQTASAKQLITTRTMRSRLLIRCSRLRLARAERVHRTRAAGSAFQWHKQGVVGSHLAAYQSQYVSQTFPSASELTPPLFRCAIEIPRCSPGLPWGPARACANRKPTPETELTNSAGITHRLCLRCRRAWNC